MGKSDLGWLHSNFHFSFADYFNPDNIQFGALRVLNDDRIEAQTGFDAHPHRDMEIISYIVDGQLTHVDSMRNKRTLGRGSFQYMSAGTGLFHSEHNLGEIPMRLLQIWILPDRKGYQPQYGDLELEWDIRSNKWYHAVSGQSGDATIKINQDANISVTEVEKGKDISFPVGPGRQAYLVQIEGSSRIKDLVLHAGDALTSVEENLEINAEETSHLLVIEMAKSKD